MGQSLTKCSGPWQSWQSIDLPPFSLGVAFAVEAFARRVPLALSFGRHVGPYILFNRWKRLIISAFAFPLPLANIALYKAPELSNSFSFVATQQSLGMAVGRKCSLFVSLMILTDRRRHVVRKLVQMWVVSQITRWCIRISPFTAGLINHHIMLGRLSPGGLLWRTTVHGVL